jgi:hypothetical protein
VAHQASNSCSLRWTNACAPGAGGVSPPWLAVTHLQGLRANVGAIADRASANSDAVAVLHPRQHSRRAHARRSCVGMRTFAGEIAAFAMDERVCIRSGGVSPPWFTVTHLQGLRANVGAIADRASAISDAFAILHVWEPAAVPEILQRASVDSGAVAVLHPRQHPRRADARRSCVGRIAACLCVAISFARAFSEPRRADARRSCLRRTAACLCVAISLARAFS